MRRRTRWLLIGSLSTVAAFAAAAWIGLGVVLPRVVRSQVRQVLSDLGLRDANFELHRSTLWHTQVAQLTAGPDAQLSIGSMMITHSPLEAIDRQIDSILIRNARLRVPTTMPADASHGSSASSARNEPLPIRSIELRDCLLVIPYAQQTIEMPLEGTLLRTPSGPSQLNVRARLDAARLNAAGTIETASGDARISVSVEELDLSHFGPLLETEITGKVNVQGEVHREGAATRAGGQFAASRVDLFGQTFTDVSLRGGFTAPAAVRIESLALDWAGGHLSAEPFDLQWPSTDVALAVSIAHVDLQKILDVISQGRARGSGSLSGRLAVAIDWPRLRFGDGVIQSDGPGTLRLGDSVTQFGQLLDQSDPRFARDAQMRQAKQQILEALTDFAYDQIRAQLSREADGLLLVSITIRGRGRTGARQPLDITLNYRGLEEGLNSYLAAHSRVLSIGGGGK
ncbi:intermembrane phospholipid transport protein YdbH family protein [Fontivita pretiosa]|uniref:intermembrane phospholipid transport protein YdbH family protein n=1 Tax=Fontivita pretiosa TaxID=2989684 RepID=UPI003D1738E8